MNNKIFQICMPSAGDIEIKDLFVRKTEMIIKYSKYSALSNCYEFNTWMNSFAARKYNKYCDIGKLFVKLDFEGVAIVEIVGSNRNDAFGLQNTTLCSVEARNGCCIEVPQYEKYESVFFRLYESKNDKIRFISGSWVTDVDPKRCNKLAVVITTFKRNDFVFGHIRKFKSFLETIENRTDYKLIVVDNANSGVFDGESDENVIVYNNINAGGAGGFGRGIYEIIKRHCDISRVIFMDDDVRIFPESFEKTLILSNYLKDPYKNEFICGAMLDLYDGCKFFENLAVQDQFWVRPYKGDFDLRKFDNVLLANDIPSEMFKQPNIHVGSGWYYHCFSVDTAKTTGLPMPFFIRGDDVEWSWRRQGKEHISMNGICVWHAPFVWRISFVTDYYYMPRNMFFVHMVYDDNFKCIYNSIFASIFKYLLATYDYVSIIIFLKAIQDIITGISVLERNPEDQFSELRDIDKLRERQKASAEDINRMYKARAHVRKYKKLIIKLFGDSYNIPNFLLKKNGYAPDFLPSPDFFLDKKEVRVINPLNKTMEIRRINHKKGRELTKKFKELMLVLDANFDKLKTESETNWGKLTSTDFWCQYLKLS